MDTPTRRDFFTYAVGATLASALPLSAQTQRDLTLMPLVINLIGPMAFRKVPAKQIVEVWLPKLDHPGKEHEAGIGTPVTSKVLSNGEYKITGPTPSNGDPTPYLTSRCHLYEVKPPNGYSATNSFIHLTVPMPSSIVALNPVRAEVWQSGSTPSGVYNPYAVGLRFLYDHAGAATLTPPGGIAGLIPFEPGPAETQLDISIGYSPYNYSDTDHSETKASFNALSLLFLQNPGLQVEFEESVAKSVNPTGGFIQYTGPHHNCKAPIILLV